MQKLLVLFSFLLFTSFTKTAEEVNVYQSKGGTKYNYKETCRRLNACKHSNKKWDKSIF
jgi:hypothetical protein